MSAPIVRRALGADVRLLQSIEDAADERFRLLLQPEEWWPAPPGQQRAAAPGFLLVVGEADAGPAVGFVHVLEVDGLAHLEQLAVLPAHGRRGLGRVLVDAALQEAGGRGHERITLRTYADVPWNAPFHRRCGFVETQPDAPFLRGLEQEEQRLGLARHGRRVQMTATIRPSGPSGVVLS